MKKIIFLVGCFFLMVNTSWAMTLNCPEVVSPGEDIYLHIEDENINGLKAKYNFDSGFIYQDINISSAWKSYYHGIDGFSIGNVTNLDSLSIDIRLKTAIDLLVNQDYTLGLVEIETSDVNYQNNNVNDLFCKVTVLSDINTLDSLIIDGIDLSPDFSKNIVRYEAITKNSKINIQATVSDTSAKIEGDIGEQSLHLGVNIFTIRVISARGSIREYKVYVTRKLVETTSNSNHIISLSSDATLKSLTLSASKIDFKKDSFLYSVDVDYDVDKIEVVAICNDEKAKVKIQKPEELVVGENIIKIIITAEDGTIATYVILVNREDKLSSDALIKSLKVKNYDISFKSNVYEYNLEIDNEDKLDIEVILNDEKAKYVIKGNKNLKNNSVIEIQVTAEDGSSNSYKIYISKPNESNSNAIIHSVKLIPLIGFILLIGLILVIKVLKSKSRTIN